MILLTITVALAGGVIYAAKRANWSVSAKTAARATGVMVALAMCVTALGVMGNAGDGYFAHAAVGWGVAAYWMALTIVLMRAETAAYRAISDTTGVPSEVAA